MHPNVYCDSCNQPGQCLVGSRWKCAQCFDFDLCFKCYMANKHDPSHHYIRYDSGLPQGITVKRYDEHKSSGSDVGVFSKHSCTSCDSCNQHAFSGTRWKCAECHDYDLCDACYQNEKHNLSHPFIRIDAAHPRNGVLVQGRHAVSAAAGSLFNVHHNCRCDACSSKNFVGSRWKCTQCYDFNLCYKCYMADKHDTSHHFMRFDVGIHAGVMVKRNDGSSHNISRRRTQEHGAIHYGIHCDTCHKSGIEGTRWKCAECHDYDLCEQCYQGQQHNMSHPFIRIETPQSIGVLVKDIQKTTASNNDSTGTRHNDRNHANTQQNEDSEKDDNKEASMSHLTEMEQRMKEMEDTITCAICLEHPKNVAFLCGHSACRGCAELLDKCHMCRKQITQKINLFN